VLGVDVGRRRIGLALSDGSGLIARPWKTVAAGETVADTVQAIVAAVEAERSGWDSDDAVGAIVVGLPRRLNGEDTDLTPAARALAGLLAGATGLGVTLQDERLTSREAESRLARTERDWRKRKAAIDAMAAAIILQDFLDAGTAPARPALD
jgi:putative Holliday junction resolvase